jgi:hypothetical protein
VAIVTAAMSNPDAPDVINGDGDRTGFSVVEAGTDQQYADVHGRGGCLSGYVSPTASPSQGSAQPAGVNPAGSEIDFFSKNVSSPSGPNSRPTPDSLYPPKGVAKSMGDPPLSM